MTYFEPTVLMFGTEGGLITFDEVGYKQRVQYDHDATILLGASSQKAYGSSSQSTNKNRVQLSYIGGEGQLRRNELRLEYH